MESLYPLIEILFTSIARSEPLDRDEYLVLDSPISSFHPYSSTIERLYSLFGAQ